MKFKKDDICAVEKAARYLNLSSWEMTGAPMLLKVEHETNAYLIDRLVEIASFSETNRGMTSTQMVLEMERIAVVTLKKVNAF